VKDSQFEDNAQADIFIDCDSSPTLEGNTYGLGVVSETCDWGDRMPLYEYECE